ncbi:hypothetical protein HBB16_16590 [Pseudonocardia sp. MCCB 268]|nr:hypothetical protein [Pseudonocardia cytotoxica]
MRLFLPDGVEPEPAVTAALGDLTRCWRAGSPADPDRHPGGLTSVRTASPATTAGRAPDWWLVST